LVLTCRVIFRLVLGIEVSSPAACPSHLRRHD
jgi:hypothetical protein